MNRVSRRLYSRTSKFLALPSFGRVAKEERGDAPYFVTGAIQNLTAGTFAIMPLAHKVLERLTAIIDHEFNALEAQKINLPSLGGAKLWKKTGRWDTYGPVLFKLKDRSGQDFCLGPTHEETITHCVASLGAQDVSSKLPLRLYQTSWKYRDEERPKRGLSRAREFLMTDMYSFDSSLDSCKETYDSIANAYIKIFQRIGLPFKKVAAASGEMGGVSSHEYHYELSSGEDTIFSCEKCQQNFNEETLENDKHCPTCSGVMESSKGVEVGHTFILGDIYSKPLEAECLSDGKRVPLQMGCYGIGVTRLISACAEFQSSGGSLRLPPSIAPFTVSVVAPKQGSKEFDKGMATAINLAENLDKILPSKRVILDDRKWTIGRKLKEIQSWGIPYQVVVGSNGLEIHSDPEQQFLPVADSSEVFSFFEKVKEEKLLL